MIKVVLIGSGNVASHLAKIFQQTKNIDLIQHYRRNDRNDHLFDQNIPKTNSLNKLKKADIYFIAISDNHISTVSEQLKFKEGLVVHTSGSISMNQLKCAAHKGVFYPLQSFSKDKKIDFSNIPICIEAENAKDLVLLEKFVNLISNNCYKINSEQRKTLHVAAVFVNNFVNHLYYIGNEICNKNKIPFEILQPIIQETAKKIVELSPYEAQTGPAQRNDSKTIEKHKAMLTVNQQEIYTLLTKSIAKTYGEKL